MLVYNKEKKMLEPEEYKFELQDVKEPNLLRETFSYSDIPKIAFNNTVVPMNPPEHIWMTDTTFRDGQQAFPPFTVDQISHLFDLMHRLGGYEFPQITSWIRANKNDFKLVKEMGIKETGILTSCSDYHIFLKLKKTRREALDMYLDIVRAALEEGIVPRCHFEDITRADFYGFVIPFAKELMKLSKQAKMPVKIRACDTLGFGVAYPGVALPRNVNGIMYGLNHHAGVPSEWLEWHGHNDFYRALTNSTFAWLYGCSGINGTLLGIGERTGNTPIEALAIEYVAFRGDHNGMDLSAITEIAKYFKQELKYDIPNMQPFVGAHFNSTRAGIHADGLLKEQEIYNVFDTKAILNRPPEVAITDRAGLAGIAYWINTQHPNFKDNDKKLDKNNPGVVKIKEYIDELFKGDRRNPLTKEELNSLVEKYIING